MKLDSEEHKQIFLFFILYIKYFFISVVLYKEQFIKMHRPHLKDKHLLPFIVL